jgi:ABC-type Zn uptake system ZnuABC Zn-binding protein ZnuA
MRSWCLILILLSLACDRTEPAAEGPISVSSATFAVADIARQVGGSEVQARWALETPESIDQYQPAPGELDSLRAADVLIVSGTIDAWILENARSMQRERGLIRLHVLPGVINAPSSALWLDPQTASALADEVAQAFAIRRPKHRQDFEKSAAKFKESLDSLRAELLPANFAGKKVATLSSTFDALLLRYEVTPVRLADKPPHQFDNQQWFEFRQAASSEGIRWLVLDASLPDSMVQFIASRTGLRMLRIETLGSSSATSPVRSYQEICRHNLQELRKLNAE